MWNKGAARLTQIHLLSQELQLLLRSTRRGSREGAEGAAEPGSALRHSKLCSPHVSTAMEPNSPKKIQFAVPLFQSQIDPEAAEQIRKRRPTPASLVIMNEHVPPDLRFDIVSTLCSPQHGLNFRAGIVISGALLTSCHA
uniref:Protein phosphatase 1 regulatory inhibitor subunit 1C n=1 Tax=Meleagris gallopavo TaxID=9103 RepID=A0A803XX15_MELGA